MPQISLISVLTGASAQPGASAAPDAVSGSSSAAAFAPVLDEQLQAKVVEQGELSLPGLLSSLLQRLTPTIVMDGESEQQDIPADGTALNTAGQTLIGRIVQFLMNNGIVDQPEEALPLLEDLVPQQISRLALILQVPVAVVQEALSQLEVLSTGEIIESVNLVLETGEAGSEEEAPTDTDNENTVLDLLSAPVERQEAAEAAPEVTVAEVGINNAIPASGEAAAQAAEILSIEAVRVAVARQQNSAENTAKSDAAARRGAVLAASAALGSAAASAAGKSAGDKAESDKKQLQSVVTAGKNAGTEVAGIASAATTTAQPVMPAAGQTVMVAEEADSAGVKPVTPLMPGTSGQETTVSSANIAAETIRKPASSPVDTKTPSAASPQPVIQVMNPQEKSVTATSGAEQSPDSKLSAGDLLPKMTGMEPAGKDAQSLREAVSLSMPNGVPGSGEEKIPHTMRTDSRVTPVFAEAPVPVIEQVLLKIRPVPSVGQTHYEIQLEPADLGKVEVRIEISTDGRTHVTMTADKKDTLDMLMRDRTGLEKSLNELGLKADAGNMNFNLREQSNNQQANDQQPGGDGRGQDESLPEELREEAPPAQPYRGMVLNLEEGVNIRV